MACCDSQHSHGRAEAHLHLLYDAGTNTHPDPKASEQHLRRCQVDRPLSTVHCLGGGPDAGAVVPNQLCRPGCRQQSLLSSPEWQHDI